MYKHIAQNKRRTVIIIIGFVLMIAAIAALFAYVYNDVFIAIWTIVAAIVYAVIQYYLAGSVAMAMTGAKEIAKKDNPRLYNIVENLSITTGLPMPKVYIIEDSAPNAFATGRDPKHASVAATTGLLDIMNDKELNAVMAHEMSHVKNYDIRVSMIVFGLVCVIGMISDIAFRMMYYGNRRRDEEGSPVGYVLILVAAILSPLVAAVAQMAVSRQREYLADSSAAHITRYPEGMIAALKKLQSQGQPMKNQNVAAASMYINDPLRKGFFNNLLSTHPPIEKRIARLENGKKVSKKNKAPSSLKIILGKVGGKFRSEKRVRLHKNFKRSYKEDYKRDLDTPGIMYHILASFKIIFKNWKVFLPLLVLSVAAAVFLIGLMSESTYQQFQSVLDETMNDIGQEEIGLVAKASLLLVSAITTGGLAGESSEVTTVFTIFDFLTIWLVSVFLLRHILAGHKVKLRDGLYNAMTPLISTLAVLIVAIIQCVPVLILTVVYSAAVQTNFLATPFYALVFFIFAALMILLSGYLLSSTLMALIAVTVPGLYPMQALRTASDLMMGRRIRFCIRVIALFLTTTIVWVLIMMPITVFDLWVKQFEWASLIPIVPVALVTMMCFTGIYVSVYFYMYYRWMLKYDKE